jgi:hypothetical protein
MVAMTRRFTESRRRLPGILLRAGGPNPSPACVLYDTYIQIAGLWLQGVQNPGRKKYCWLAFELHFLSGSAASGLDAEAVSTN